MICTLTYLITQYRHLVPSSGAHPLHFDCPPPPSSPSQPMTFELFPVQQKINKADGVCVCQFRWHICQSEGVGNTEAAVMEAINLSAQSRLTSIKKRKHWKNTIDSYVGFYGRGYVCLVSDPALSFIYYVCFDRRLTISSHL